MDERRTLIRAPALAVAIVAALLLLAGTYAVTAGPAPSVTPELALAEAANGPTEWSSGWVSIPAGASRVFTHGLGYAPEQYAVETWFQDLDDGWGLNRRYYGGVEDNGDWYGAHWQNLTTNTIRIYRQQQDDAADRIRVRVSVPPRSPDRDSGWMDIAPGETLTYSHGLGITATELTVGMWFSSTSLLGIHNFGYGGVAVDIPPVLEGAHWHHLTDNEVRVTRHPGDRVVQQVRVIVVHGDTPHYDSLVDRGGWQTIAPGTVFTFEHNLHWNPEMMLVRGECYSSTVGIHQWLVGGSVKGWPPHAGLKGAHAQNLTADTVEVYRWPNDDVCPQVRVRIWRRTARLYLPLVLK